MISMGALQGVELMKNRLLFIDLQMQRKIMKNALMAAAVPIRDAAISKSYAFRRNEEVPESRKSKERKPNRNDYVVTYRARDGRVLVGPPKSKFYLYFMEVGTRRQPARPFMRPAFDANKERAESILIEELRKGIEEAARSVA